MQMENYILSNDLSIPKIGYGTWKLDNGKATVEAVTNALKLGYRHIDTAYSYGNDFSVGKAIKNCIQNNYITREDLFITNKVWNTFRGYENTIAVCKKTLKLMKLDYLDLYLIHWPVSYLENNWKEVNSDTWRGMEQLYKEGIVKSIGVSNFLPHHMNALKENGASIMPMVNQIEFHIGKRDEENLIYCKSNNILVEGWSPLGSGEVLKNKLLCDIAFKYNKTPAQISILWCIQNNVIPLPRSSNIKRMEENISVFNFVINEEDMKILNNIPYCGGSGLDPDTNQPQV